MTACGRFINTAKTSEGPVSAKVEAGFLVPAPNGLAWDYLCELDLGPQFGKHQGALGEIRFIDGPCPGNDSRWVEVDDLISISLLQNRLNELGENTSLEINDSPF